MALVLSLLPDPTAHARVVCAAESLRGSRMAHRVYPAKTWDEVCSFTLRSATRAVIFDPFISGTLDMEACVQFRAAFSSVVLFAYGNFRSADEVMRLAQCGVDGVAVRNLDDDPAALRELFRRALEHGFADRVLTTLADDLSPELVPVFRYLLEHTPELITPRDVASAAFCHPKTLRERLQRAHLPPTGHLIVWTRLLHAAYLLEDAGRTIENVAELLGFPSAAALGNQIKRYAGFSPLALRRSGGLLMLVKIFRLQILGAVGP